MSLKSTMTRVLIRRDPETDTQGEGHVTTEAEVGVALTLAEGCQHNRSSEECMEQTLL